ncbi:hypothetical protein GG496_001574 [Candidatus Fervidibacteria bacterium JGI MDM2 JNZ-1-D12]
MPERASRAGFYTLPIIPCRIFEKANKAGLKAPPIFLGSKSRWHGKLHDVLFSKPQLISVGFKPAQSHERVTDGSLDCFR